MIDSNRTKVIKKLFGYQKLLIMKQIEIQCQNPYMCNDELSYTIPNISYTLLIIT